MFVGMEALLIISLFGLYFSYFFVADKLKRNVSFLVDGIIIGTSVHLGIIDFF